MLPDSCSLLTHVRVRTKLRRYIFRRTGWADLLATSLNARCHGVNLPPEFHRVVSHRYVPSPGGDWTDPSPFSARVRRRRLEDIKGTATWPATGKLCWSWRVVVASVSQGLRSLRYSPPRLPSQTSRSRSWAHPRAVPRSEGSPAGGHGPRAATEEVSKEHWRTRSGDERRPRGRERCAMAPRYRSRSDPFPSGPRCWSSLACI